MKIPRVAFLVKMTPDDLETVDQARGLMSRQDFVAGAAIRLAKHAEETPEPINLGPRESRSETIESYRARTLIADRERGKLGPKMIVGTSGLKPYRAPIGSRLKAK